MKKSLLLAPKSVLKKLALFAAVSLSTNANSQCDINISIDSTLNCFGDSTAALSVEDPINATISPLMITEVDRNSPDLIEIENISGVNFDATGYYVSCSNDYGNINIANALTWNLSGTLPAGWIDFRDDNAGANYWGNNLFFAGTSPGWVAICDPSNNVVDIIFWEWSAADISTFAPVVNGNTLVLDPSQWAGDGVTGGCTTGSMSRSSNIETNTNVDFTCGTGVTAGVSNMTTTPVSTLLITEVDRNAPDLIEIENVASFGFDATGYYVACSDDYGNINIANALTWNLSGTLPAGWIDFRDDNAGANYWGNNLFFAGTSPGWVAICDPSNNVVDIIFWEWSAADISTFAPVVNGNTLVLNPSQWVGDGVTGGCTTGSLSRSTNTDTNTNTDWTCGTGATAGVSNISAPSSISAVLWSTSDSTLIIDNLGAGTYNVQVTFQNGCIASDSVTITEPAALTSTFITTDISCFGGTNGTATAVATGGTGLITVDWGVNDPLNLSGGYTSIMMTDSLGCTGMDSVFINEPAVLDLSITGQDLLCSGDSTGGSANVAVTGGTPGYTYSWSNGDTTSVANGLAIGWYSVSVADTNGCTIQDSVEISEPAALTLSGTTSDEISGTDGSIDLTLGGGTPPYTYAWTNGAPAVEDPTGLVGGTYDVTVTDSNGCTITDSYVVNSQVGISELDQLQFNVFPNPSNGEFKLTLNSNVYVNVHVINTLGQVIYKDELSGSSKEIKLNSTQVGVYFVRLFNDELSTVRRIVIK